jgi:hypothetical protein
MSEHRTHVLVGLSHDARGRPFKIDEMRTEPTLKFPTYGSARLDCGRGAIQSLDASAPGTGRVVLESDWTQNLEGRPLAMYAALRLPDRSRLGLLSSRQRSVPHSANRSEPMSGRNERREPS